MGYIARVDTSLLASLYTDHVAELSRRYAPALEAAGYDHVVIHSGSPKKRTEFDDQYWPLRPTPHFHHWLPLSEADSALVITPGKKPKLAWLVETSFWENPAPPETDHFLPCFEVVEVSTHDEVKDQLPTSGRVAFISEDRARAVAWGFADANVNPPELMGRLDGLRTKKTPYEVLCLEEANRRAAVGHEALVAMFWGDDHSELELHLAFLRATGQDDPETPYKNIVAVGANAATLHHISYGKLPKSGPDAQSLLVDAGATYQGYCSDITRTWVKGGGAAMTTFSQIVDGVERMQQRLCGEVKLGQPYEQLHEAAHRYLADVLREAGVVTVSTDEAVAGGITRAFFPHGLGHSLGLQCHDVGCALIKPRPDNPFLRNTSIIAPGQVFTIEPGIYFIDGLLEKVRSGPASGGVDWKIVEELMPLGGVRIEDDLVVTEGPSPMRNLTREFLPLGGGR